MLLCQLSERLVLLFTLLKCGVSLYSGGMLDVGLKSVCNTKNWLFMSVSGCCCCCCGGLKLFLPCACPKWMSKLAIQSRSWLRFRREMASWTKVWRVRRARARYDVQFLIYGGTHFQRAAICHMRRACSQVKTDDKCKRKICYDFCQSGFWFLSDFDRD